MSTLGRRDKGVQISVDFFLTFCLSLKMMKFVSKFGEGEIQVDKMKI